MNSTAPLPAARVTRETAVEILRDLVATRSLTGQEDHAVAAFVEHAAAIGFDAHIDEVGNGIASRQGEGPVTLDIALVGHIDTVPGEIPVRIEENVLHGRGSVDAKGPLCAFLVGAAEADLPPGVRVRVAAALGEEEDSPGAQHLRDTWRPDACFIGEPSGWNGVTLGYKGRLVVEVEVTTPSGHSAGEDRSAPDIALSWWRDAMTLLDRLNTERETTFDTFDSIHATITGMGSESDGLTDRARMTCSFRVPEWITPEGLGPELRALCRGDERIALRLGGFEPAHRSDRNDACVRALTGAIRGVGARPHPKLKTGTCDMNVVARTWRCPIAAYGPGDSGLDHSPIEHLDLDEYARSIRVVRGAIERLAREMLETRGQGSAV
ncbi:MAG: [LysW]-lysine hydrolase [Phycisphaerales bacterium JB059]